MSPGDEYIIYNEIDIKQSPLGASLTARCHERIITKLEVSKGVRKV